MHPVDALNEIAFWLERELASSYKTKAFRGAAAALTGKDIAKVASGALKIKGVGESSLAVIREALAGEVPSYLADLRAKARPVPSVKLSLRGDLHTHSEWSDGTTPIELMASTAQWLGREYIALTDHSPRLKIANGLSSERLRDQLKIVAKLNAASSGFRILSGIEVDILDDGSLDQTPAMLDKLDIVVASAHSKLRMPRREMTARLLGAVRNPHTSVLGHVTGRLVKGSRGTRPQSEFDAAAVFAECAERGVAVEINSRPERQDPPDTLLKIAVDAGCLFSIDSDAHAPGHLGFVADGAARAEAAGIPADRIVTTWKMDRLLDWASAR